MILSLIEFAEGPKPADASVRVDREPEMRDRPDGVYGVSVEGVDAVHFQFLFAHQWLPVDSVFQQIGVILIREGDSLD